MEAGKNTAVSNENEEKEIQTGAVFLPKGEKQRLSLKKLKECNL